MRYAFFCPRTRILQISLAQAPRNSPSRLSIRGRRRNQLHRMLATSPGVHPKSPVKMEITRKQIILITLQGWQRTRKGEGRSRKKITVPSPPRARGRVENYTTLNQPEARNRRPGLLILICIFILEEPPISLETGGRGEGAGDGFRGDASLVFSKHFRTI